SGFRLLRFSVMSNHLHFIVEAESARALSGGMQGLLVRIARGLNRALNRTGRVFADRFHSRRIGSTLDVKNTIAYVLGNARRHGVRFRGAVDPYSSAAWFRGWRDFEPAARPAPIAAPRSWQLRFGWSPHGRLDPASTPRGEASATVGWRPA
ncbi:MAG TPA: transposase, partial [Pirellulaceae bacterium]|nr:transposase [Pirellulaceae bacterium]